MAAQQNLETPEVEGTWEPDVRVPSWWQHDDRCGLVPLRQPATGQFPRSSSWPNLAGWQGPLDASSYYGGFGPFGPSGGHGSSLVHGGHGSHGGYGPDYGDFGGTIDKLVNIVDGLAKDLRHERAERKALEEAFYSSHRDAPYGQRSLLGTPDGHKISSSQESETGSDYGKAPRRLSRGWASVLSESPPFGGPRNALK